MTRKELVSKVDVISNMTARKFVLDWTTSRPRLCISVNEHGGIRHLSPRLTVGKLYEWIEAFQEGINFYMDYLNG